MRCAWSVAHTTALAVPSSTLTPTTIGLVSRRLPAWSSGLGWRSMTAPSCKVLGYSQHRSAAVSLGRDVRHPCMGRTPRVCRRRTGGTGGRPSARVTTSVATAGSVLNFALESAFGLPVSMASFGAIMGLALKRRTAGIKHPILGGAALFAAPDALPRTVAGAGAGGHRRGRCLGATSPWIASFIRPKVARARVFSSAHRGGRDGDAGRGTSSAVEGIHPSVGASLHTSGAPVGGPPP